MNKDMNLLKNLAQLSNGADAAELEEFSAEYQRERQLIDKGI